jgi:hypothetical protein
VTPSRCGGMGLKQVMCGSGIITGLAVAGVGVGVGSAQNILFRQDWGE